MYDYEIDVFVPTETPPAEGFPVIYVLDGQRYAQMMQIILNVQLRNASFNQVGPAVIVSIGHREADNPQQRFYDFTSASTKVKGHAATMENGGAAIFQRYLQQLMNDLAAKYPINEKMQILFAHSLGGLFALWNYKAYKSFQQYIVISPSLWWDDAALLKEQLPLHSPLFLAVGGDEGDMKEDLEHFAKLNHLAIQIIAEENHTSVVSAIMNQVLRFIESNRQ